MGHLVSTERLGWPAKRWWRGWLPIEVQRRHQYDHEPDRPTATCHLQEGSQLPSLCGYPWESLVAIPSSPDWNDLHPDRRCERCSEISGSTTGSSSPCSFDRHQR